MIARMSQEVTKLLKAAEEGDPSAAAELLPLVYEDLRKLAAAKMAAQPPGHTLQATALVHEAWLRIAPEQHPWKSRKHFFVAAAEAMRRILVDQARRKQRQKRGGPQRRVPLEEIDIPMETGPAELVAIHEALDRLAQADARKAELVKLRFFAGLPISEAAKLLDISESTAKREWNFVRAWLYDELQSGT
jgi:RNA polymerase sigma factor (TIGR02999 family)